jgi:hypothetical protein
MPHKWALHVSLAIEHVSDEISAEDPKFEKRIKNLKSVRERLFEVLNFADDADCLR